MTKLARAVVTALPLAVLLVACAPAAGPDPAEPAPDPSLAPSSASPPPAALPRGAELTGWAADALPEDTPGGSGAAARDVRALTAATPAAMIVTQPAGQWDLAITCQSDDGSPVSIALDSPGGSAPWPVDLACSAPGEPQPSTMRVRYAGGGEATLTATSSTDAVLAYRVTAEDDTTR